MSVNLQYNYAVIDSNYRCRHCGTFSYEVVDPYYIEIPYATNDYRGKYYNLNGDQMWYLDSGFTQIWEECPSHNI